MFSLIAVGITCLGAENTEICERMYYGGSHLVRIFHGNLQKPRIIICGLLNKSYANLWT